MPVVDLMPRRRCGRKTRSGGPCTQWAMHGQTVCKMHGGKSPQALASAEDRMRKLVHPAISSLARLVEKDEFSATRYVLDWAGFRPVDQQTPAPDGAISVTVVFDHAGPDSESPTLRLTDAD